MNYVYYPASRRRNSASDVGNAILSPWPILESRKLLQPHTSRILHRARAAATARVHVAGRAFRVYSIHPGLSARSERRQPRPGGGRVGRRRGEPRHGHHRGGLQQQPDRRAVRGACYFWPTRSVGKSVMWFSFSTTCSYGARGRVRCSAGVGAPGRRCQRPPAGRGVAQGDGMPWQREVVDAEHVAHVARDRGAHRTRVRHGRADGPVFAVSGGVWKLRDLQLPNFSVVPISDPDHYTVAFRDAGQLAVKADCNVCGGSYLMGGGDSLQIGGLACTLGDLPRCLAGCRFPGDPDERSIARRRRRAAHDPVVQRDVAADSLAAGRPPYSLKASVSARRPSGP